MPSSRSLSLTLSSLSCRKEQGQWTMLKSATTEKLPNSSPQPPRWAKNDVTVLVCTIYYQQLDCVCVCVVGWPVNNKP